MIQVVWLAPNVSNISLLLEPALGFLLGEVWGDAEVSTQYTNDGLVKVTRHNHPIPAPTHHNSFPTNKPSESSNCVLQHHQATYRTVIYLCLVWEDDETRLKLNPLNRRRHTRKRTRPHRPPSSRRTGQRCAVSHFERRTFSNFLLRDGSRRCPNAGRINVKLRCL